MTPEEIAAQEKADAEAKAKADADAKAAEENKEKPVGEILDGGKKDEEGKTIPEAAFLEEKKGRKEAEKRIKELQKKLDEGGGRSDIGDALEDIEAIGKEFNVNGDFLRKLTSSIETRLGKRSSSDDDTTKRLNKLEDENRTERMNNAFEQHFATAMERMPEFKTIVNKAAIKALTLDPANKNKTFTQIIEETYGAAVPGKRTIETTRPGGGKEPGEVDYDRAAKDTTYFKEIMKDPVQKKKYNDGLINRIRNAI